MSVRNNFVMVDKEFLDIAIENMERVESLREQLEAKIMLVNRGDEEARYAEQERIKELEKQNKSLRVHVEQLEREVKGLEMMYEDYR